LYEKINTFVDNFQPNKELLDRLISEVEQLETTFPGVQSKQTTIYQDLTQIKQELKNLEQLLPRYEELQSISKQTQVALR
jgi:hypothetical protein